MPSGFFNQTVAANLQDLIRCVSGVAADFDNDMDKDLYLVCRGGVQNDPNMLLENDGSGVFSRVPLAGGAEGALGIAVAQNAGTGDSVAVADVNNDGRLDLVVTNGLNMRPQPANGGPTQLFLNASPQRNWLHVDLVGTNSNRDAVGAKVRVTAGGVTQLREQNEGYHRWSQSHRRLHFGLAASTQANVSVKWPNGGTSSFSNVAANRIDRITEGGGIAAVTPAKP